MEHRRYRSGLLASSLLKIPYTNEDTSSLPYLHCANKEEVNYVLQEIHEGIYGNHAGARSLAGKALRGGYYWPTLQKDEYDLVKACDQCQRFVNVQTRPGEPMMPITALWPFT